MTFKTILAALALSLPVVASAGVVYDCDITKRDPKIGWVPAKVMIEIGSNGSIRVIDDVVYHFVGKPISGYGADEKRKLRLFWKLKNVRDSINQKTTLFEYSAIITKSTNAIAVYANPTDTPQRWSGRGKCNLHQNTKLPKNLG